MLQECLNYIERNGPDIAVQILDHMKISLAALLIAVLIGVAGGYAASVSRRGEKWIMGLFQILRVIPSLAILVLLIPLTGLGRTTAVIVLCAYNQYLLLGNFLTGLNEVDPGVREAAKGIGMTAMQELFLVQIPLARKALFAGIRLAMVSTIGIGTIAAAINAGGLGTLLFDGLRTMNTAKILWGSLLSAVLAGSANGLLKLAEKGVRR